MKKTRLYALSRSGKIIVLMNKSLEYLEKLVITSDLKNYCIVKPLKNGGWRYDFYKFGEFSFRSESEFFHTLTKPECDFLKEA